MKKKVFKIILSVIGILFVIIAAGFVYFRAVGHVKTEVKPGTLTELTAEQKLEDFDYMYNILKDNHPYFEVESRKTGYNWLNREEEFKKWILDTENNQEYYNTIERILNLIQNGHTDIIEPDSYADYVKLYKGLNNKAWADVLSDKNVSEKYKVWSSNISKVTVNIPINFKYIEGNYIAVNYNNTDIYSTYNIPEYSILEKVDGVNIDDYIKTIMDKKFLTYDYSRNKVKASNLVIPCEIDKGLKLVLKTPGGKRLEKYIKSEIQHNYQGKGNMPDKVYETEIIKDKTAAYLKVSSLSAFYVDKDREGIHNFLEKVKDYPYLIIDIRGNGGGSEQYYIQNIIAPLTDKTLKTSFYMAFRPGDYIKHFMVSRGIIAESIKKLPEGLNYPPELKTNFSKFLYAEKNIEPQDSVGFKGKIYLLVDDYVYSSAESFAAVAKSTGWAKLVGTYTGGDGIGIDPAIFALPNSGLIVRFPLEMGLNPDGTSNEEKHTAPDIYAEQTYSDFVKYQEYWKTNRGIINPYDTVINKVLGEIK
jgi:C-terminal processing protease CtpA/Prc